MAKDNDKSGSPLPESKIRPLRRMKVRRSIYTYVRKDPDHDHFDEYIDTEVPWINLKGLWLRHAGFEIGTPITLVVTEGCMVLSADTESEDDSVDVDGMGLPGGDDSVAETD